MKRPEGYNWSGYLLERLFIGDTSPPLPPTVASIRVVRTLPQKTTFYECTGLANYESVLDFEVETHPQFTLFVILLCIDVTYHYISYSPPCFSSTSMLKTLPEVVGL